jgi:hypothetical protein
MYVRKEFRLAEPQHKLSKKPSRTGFEPARPKASADFGYPIAGERVNHSTTLTIDVMLQTEYPITSHALTLHYSNSIVTKKPLMVYASRHLNPSIELNLPSNPSFPPKFLLQSICFHSLPLRERTKSERERKDGGRKDQAYIPSMLSATSKWGGQ